MVQPTVQPSGRQQPPDEDERDEERRGIAHHEAQEAHTALDLLEDEDRQILRLWAEVEATRSRVADDTGGQRVEDLAYYGNHAKLLVRHFATREAAVVDVAEGLAGVGDPAELRSVAERLMGGDDERREHMDRIEKMSRGVQGMDLNTAQDFDGELTGLMERLRPQIEWELGEAIPTVREHLGPERPREIFHSARYVARHAPTHVAPGGPHWYERAPVVSRVIAAVQHLRDYPRATRDART